MVLDVPLERAFEAYGRWAYSARYVLIALPIVLTVLLSPGFFLLVQENKLSDISEIYSPASGPHEAELAAYSSRWPPGPGRFCPHNFQWSADAVSFLDVMVWTEEDGGNLLGFEEELRSLELSLSTELTVPVLDPRVNQIFNDSYALLCADYDGFCYSNLDTLDLLLDHKKEGQKWEEKFRKEGSLASYIFQKGEISQFYLDLFEIKWPSSSKQGLRKPVYEALADTDAVTSLDFVDVYNPEYSAEKMDLLVEKLEKNPYTRPSHRQRQKLNYIRMANAADPKVAGITKRMIEELQRDFSPALGRFSRVGSLRFFYAVEKGNHSKGLAGQRWFEKAKAHLKETRRWGNLSLDFFYWGRFGESSEKFTGLAVQVYVFVYAILGVFVVLCGLVARSGGGIDWVRSKSPIALAGVASGGMAVLSTYGLLNYFTALAAPLLVTGLFYWILPESLHWLVANNRVEEAKAYLKRASRIAGTEVSYETLIAQGKVQKSLKVGKKRTVLDIFTRNPVLAVQTLLMAYIWINSSLIYYALSFFSTRLAGDKYVNYLLSGLVEIPAPFIAPLGMHLVGRRPVAVLFFVLCGASLIALAALPSEGMETTTLCLNLLGKMSISCGFNCIFLYIVELFPTTVRNVGGGFCSMAARFGAIMAPYAGALSQVDPDIPPFLFGSMSLLSGLCALAMPETRGRRLAEDVDEALVGPLMSLFYPAPSKLASVQTDKSTKLLLPSPTETADTLSSPEQLQSV